jgi:DNA-binding LacI/PurR family transcriptional regulator
MRDVAREAGVAQSTVSRALRDDPRIREGERARIKQVAQRIGYRPNPFVAAFTAQVLHHRRSPQEATIALLDANPAGAPDYSQLYREGVRKRAEALGFRTEPFRLASLGGSLKRLRQVLDARGISALLVLPVRAGVELEGFDFKGLAVATVDPTLHRPTIPRAEADYFGGMRLALDELEARGYRRIAFCTTRGEVGYIGRQWLGAFAGWQRLRPEAERMDAYLGDGYDEAGFGRWLEAARPDALVVNSLCFLTWARKRGLRPPRVGFVTLGADPGRRPRLAGVAQGGDRVGAAAVDMIVTRIHRNDYGLPALPERLMVEPVWFEGGSLRPRLAPAS